MSESVDFLIVGGGISGTILQLELQKQGYQCLMFNKAENNVCSVVSAGVANPIAGKYFALTWRADDFFNDLEVYYRTLEQTLDTRFFETKNILRIFSSPGEQNDWMGKVRSEQYRKYCIYEEMQLPHINTNYGLLKIQGGGLLNPSLFINAALSYFHLNKNLRDELFDFEQLNLRRNSYQDIKFDYIVFCEGHEMLNNLLFNYLPLTPNKGELLEIEAKGLPAEEIVTGGVFILNTGLDTFKVGATYDHKDISLKPTQEQKNNLCRRLEAMTDIDYKVVNHYAGIRPAVRDRRPLLGRHPRHENLYLFNGMGSKAISMAPVLAKELINYIIHRKDIHPACNIARFKA